MSSITIAVIIYVILGICYAIDIFHTEYKPMVIDQKESAGKFFILVIGCGVLWPMVIVLLAILDIRNER